MRTRGFWLVLAARIVSAAALVVVAWVAVTAFPMLVHGQPTYLVLLALTTVFALIFGVRAWRGRGGAPKHRVLRGVGVVASILWLVLIGWLAPSVATQPALAAMESSASVTVTETASEIVFTPTGLVNSTGLFFQPGAKVDARAYAAVLRPIADAGHVVVIVKQPLGIAFLSASTFGSSRTQFSAVKNWVVGGHSLGGTVASIDANAYCGASTEPVVGLLLFASYPASDLSSSLHCPVLSISASNDGLATPASIDSTKKLLPSDTRYDQIAGAVHAYFGDYGTQSGDGQPTISHAEARSEISRLAVQFMKGK